MDQIISTLDQKHLQLSIFMDLSKSFNMFNHKIFLKNYIMVRCYTGFPFILSTESNMWNWIACNLPHQCSTQVQFGSWYIYYIYHDKVRTTHQTTTKLGSFIALVMFITWLDFGEVLLENVLFANFLGHISGMVGLIDVKRKGKILFAY